MNKLFKIELGISILNYINFIRIRNSLKDISNNFYFFVYYLSQYQANLGHEKTSPGRQGDGSVVL